MIEPRRELATRHRGEHSTFSLPVERSAAIKTGIEVSGATMYWVEVRRSWLAPRIERFERRGHSVLRASEKNSDRLGDGLLG
jgi:hypothetical protein